MHMHMDMEPSGECVFGDVLRRTSTRRAPRESLDISGIFRDECASRPLTATYVI